MSQIPIKWNFSSLFVWALRRNRAASKQGDERERGERGHRKAKCAGHGGTSSDGSPRLGLTKIFLGREILAKAALNPNMEEPIHHFKPSCPARPKSLQRAKKTRDNLNATNLAVWGVPPCAPTSARGQLIGTVKVQHKVTGYIGPVRIRGFTRKRINGLYRVFRSAVH